MVRMTTAMVRQAKGKKPVTMLTAYDYPTARIFDQLGIDIMLVGDSMGNVVYGYDSTLPVTLEQTIYHCRAVRTGATTHSLVVGDLPFLTYGVSVEKTVENAGRVVKEGGAEAVKLEGGTARKDEIKACLDIGVPVMGHLGLTPQSVHKFGGYKVQGKSAQLADVLVEEAQELERAGCFSIVLEGIPWQVAKVITNEINIPTIGIGAGPHCDGQVLVWQDALGLFDDFVPKFVKQYANLKQTIAEAVAHYKSDVIEGHFPSVDQSYEMPPEELEKWSLWKKHQ